MYMYILHGDLIIFYQIFNREEESLVDVFIIEMLVVMVNSLKLAHKDAQSTGIYIISIIIIIIIIIIKAWWINVHFPWITCVVSLKPSPPLVYQRLIKTEEFPGDSNLLTSALLPSGY